MSTTYNQGVSDALLERSSIVGDTTQSIVVYKVSWGAIFAGVVVALVTQVLLTMLGAGIGIATLDPRAGDNPAASTFSVVAGIWYVLSGIVSAFAGGYVAARMSGRTDPTTGALHGLTTWAFTTLLVLYMLTSAVGSLVGGAFSGVASAVGGVGATVAQTAAPLIANSNPLEALDAQIRATGTDPEALTGAAVNAMRALVVGDEASAPQARAKAAQALSTARRIPLPEATQQVAAMEKEYRDQVAYAKNQALEAADATASIVSTGALLAFAALVLGAISGWFGGRSGVMNPLFADRIVPARRGV
ncbi:PhnA-like protein [Mesorhizobium sp. BAC0120]|uniref:PhnA-like protein n=1 Tax=Mesorhizobium sp. BAC0120 TaxID=3090670 RepID=UPI00298C59C0|nr:PhnA-like protein [Mesorhizobium sp. BAC0120]MDW6026515.1 PhnA-like protein [Mesorhizobium sp. BAC0120]